MKLDLESYEQSAPLKLAFNDGKLAMCEQIKEFARILMAEYNLNPLKIHNPYEEGQISVIGAFIEQCLAYEQSQENIPANIHYDA